ncbi:MAG: cytochrome oxidase subunit III [Rhodospirillales bacterium 69-11]|nr:cytochrome c oxidase subunit 3 [Rhodospirillales bacterium]OJW29578.1 MAG: cytochrome oxidase subunit III [Rhodospirillales bacterium 69-11]
MSSTVGIELEEQYHDVEQQREAAKLGMWTFLLTELLLFSGLFVTALVLRVMHPDSVTAVALHLKFWIGATNTAILIVSSFIMSVAIELSRLGRQRPMAWCMLGTAAFGVLFLMLKGYEYYRDYVEHMTPFLSFRRYELVGDPASRLFTNLYFITTGLHAVHLIIGITLMLVMAWLASREGFLQKHQNRIEITGLYWHFIDLIWMIVFPTLYLLNR